MVLRNAAICVVVLAALATDRPSFWTSLPTPPTRHVEAKEMPTFKVEIIQDYKVRRRITVDVEAVDMLSAIEQQAAIDAPDFDDPKWLTGWELVQEMVVPPGKEGD